MNNNELLDIYSDYLLSAFGRTTSTGLSELLDGQLSHDQIQRFLNGREFTSADLWGMVKGAVRQMESSGGSLIIDDSIAEKPYMGENSLVCWHYDHSSGSTVKGINFISAVYCSQRQTLPVGFRLVEKDEWYEAEDGERKRRSRVSKNSHYQALLKQAVVNRIPFQYVLNDVWYASAENMRFVVETLHKDFVMPLKANRKVALSAEDKKRGRYVRVSRVLCKRLELDASIKIDHQLIQDFGPVREWHSPFGGDVTVSQVEGLADCHIGWKNRLVLGDFA